MNDRKLKKITFMFVAGLLAIMPLLLAQTAAAEPKAIRIGHLGDWTGPAGRTCGGRPDFLFPPP
ncbi:MAG: hypothetical protein SV487_04980 [Thermodesulfobacteriota bacterium]|nr:hypothetical protein [Thermodesulfobacteriota bacterium]